MLTINEKIQRKYFSRNLSNVFFLRLLDAVIICVSSDHNWIAGPANRTAELVPSTYTHPTKPSLKSFENFSCKIFILIIQSGHNFARHDSFHDMCKTVTWLDHYLSCNSNSFYMKLDHELTNHYVNCVPGIQQHWGVLLTLHLALAKNL